MTYQFETRQKVRSYECDMQGVVNNSFYLAYLEHARQEFLESLGGSFKELVDQRIFVMVAHIDIDFKTALKSGDHYAIRLNCRRQGAKLILDQDIYRLPDDRLSVRARVDLVCQVHGRISRGDFFDQLPGLCKRAYRVEEDVLG